MPVIESSPNRLVLKSGSTTLTLDRDADRAALQRKIVFWSLKPSEMSLSQIADVSAGMAVDSAPPELKISGTQGWFSVPEQVGRFRPRTSRKQMITSLPSANSVNLS